MTDDQTCPSCLGLFAPAKGGKLCARHHAERLRVIADRVAYLDGTSRTGLTPARPSENPECQHPPTGRAQP